MKSFSNIGDPFGFSRPEEAYVPPQRVINIFSKILANGGATTPIDVSWCGALLVAPSFESVTGTQGIVSLPPLKDVPNGWYVSFICTDYSNTSLVIRPMSGDGFGTYVAPTTNDYKLQAGRVVVFTAVDFSGSPNLIANARVKRWIVSSFVGHESHIGGSSQGNGGNISAFDNVIIGGYNNSNAGGQWSLQGIGNGHSTYNGSYYGVILNGTSNKCVTGNYPTVLNGNNNFASGDYATVLNGSNHYQVGFHNTFLNGQYSHDNGLTNYTMFTSGAGLVYGTGTSTRGYSNIGLMGLATLTLNATPKALTTTGGTASSTNQLTFNNNTLVRHIKGSVVAVSEAAGNATKVWEFSAVARRISGGNVTIVGLPVINVIAGDGAGVSAWNISLSADTTNQAFAVTVTGAAATAIRWNCRLDLVDVGV